MALIGKWKGDTKTGSQVYRVTGSEDEIEDFIEKSNIKIFEEDGTPLFFTRTLTKQGLIKYNEDKERWYIEVSFESAVLKEAARRSFESSSESSERDDESGQEPADLEGEKKDSKPATPKKGSRKIK